MENNEQNTAAATGIEAQTVDYKALYEKATAEMEKQKGLKDQYARENAEYKRKEKDAMTDEQKKAEADAEREKAFLEMQTELAEIKLEKEILSNGFSTEEADKLKGLKIPQEAIKPIAEIITARLNAYASSLKATAIKETTPEQLKGSTAHTQPKSYAEKLAEQQFSNNNNLDKIKNYYKK